MKFYKLKISLIDVKQEVSRVILVPEDVTFGYLHLTIQKVMGWENKHLYMFQVGDRYIDSDDLTKSIGSQKNKVPTFAKISDLINIGDTFNYIYDMGDEWRHKIKVLGLIDTSLCEPIILRSVGKCPKEDSRS